LGWNIIYLAAVSDCDLEDSMYTLLVFLFLLISILMVLVILMQSSKGGGLASSFGGLGGGAFLGARGTANFLQKSTMFLGVAYGAICILIGIYISVNSQSMIQKSEAEQMFEKVQQGASSVVAPAPFDVKDAQPVPVEESQKPEQAQPKQEKK
jgi:preprotein translocase subunit SecG